MSNIIKKYVSMLTIKDISDFGIKNDIYLDNDELNVLYDVIKNNYEILLNDDKRVFKYLEGKIRTDNLNKIKTLFYGYKEKYQNYL
jgi:hypothetical protein